MSFQQRIEGCFTGEGNLSRARFEAVLARTGAALGRLADARASGSLPLLALPTRSDDLAPILAQAERLSARFAHVLVMGTGGSSLGGRTINTTVDRGFGPPQGRPALRFLENVDPDSITALQVALPMAETALVVISKSGSTVETLAQFLTLLPGLAKAHGDKLGEALVVITEPKPSPLRDLAVRFGATLLDHDPGVGGRFSVLSPVGLLPAALAGLDPRAIRKGAAVVLDENLNAGSPSAAPAAIGAALAIAASEAGLGISVLMPYADRLADFGLWYNQLWAESLGKGGKGTTPIRALGTVDQHSQLQLYLDGPRDKLFTLLTVPSAGQGTKIEAQLAEDAALGYLAGRSLGDLLAAAARATAETLTRNGRPTRVIALDRLDGEVLGALFMHFMLETIIAADLLGVDPFDQPAVEEGKILARRIMTES